MRSNSFKIRYKTFFDLLFIPIGIIAMLFVFFNERGDYDALLGYCILALNLLTMIKVRHNWYLLFILLCITYSNYSICAANYISRINTYFSRYAGTEVGSLGVNILLLFSALLLIFTPKTYPMKTEKKKALIINNRENPIIVIGAIIILALIWIYGYKRPDAVGQRGSPSALYEYSIIFLIIAFYYSGKNRFLIHATIISGLLFALQNFAFGGRITGIQILVMIVFAVFVDRLRIGFVLPLAVVFFLIMSVIGQLRGMLLVADIDAKTVINHLAERKFALDTAYSSYFTSMTFLDEISNTTVSGRLNLFVRWVLSIFLGGSVPDSNLSIYTRRTHVHYFGGVLPYFFWFYLGFIGLFLLVLYLRFHFKIMDKVNIDSSGLARCIALYTTCTCLRWYLYSPSQLFRGVLLLSLVYAFCYGADTLMRKRAISRTYDICNDD